MYSAEPLPHFVDEYLAYLYEVHPTNATFDGVHVHDDLLEDYRRQAIDVQIRTLAGFGRRLGAIDPTRLTEVERLERRALQPLDVGQARGVNGSETAAKPAEILDLGVNCLPAQVFEQIVMQVDAVKRSIRGMNLIQIREVFVHEMRKGFG